VEDEVSKWIEGFPPQGTAGFASAEPDNSTLNDNARTTLNDSARTTLNDSARTTSNDSARTTSNHRARTTSNHRAGTTSNHCARTMSNKVAGTEPETTEPATVTVQPKPIPTIPTAHPVGIQVTGGDDTELARDEELGRVQRKKRTFLARLFK